MGPGSFGTGKTLQRQRESERKALASMGPGSFGTGKVAAVADEATRAALAASMGPGSFGTGKLTTSNAGAKLDISCFNGARFFWNREASAVGALDAAAVRDASMGPGSFGTGKPRAAPCRGPR